MKILSKIGVSLGLFFLFISFSESVIARSTRIRNENSERIVEVINDELRKNLQVDSLVNTAVIIAPEIKSELDERFDSFALLRILGLIIPFIFSFAVLWIILYYKKQRFKEKCRVIDKAIDANYELPDSFYSGKQTFNMQVDKRTDTENPVKYTVINPNKLYSSLIWIAAGLTGFIFFLVVGSEEMAVIALLPLFIGVAKIISYYLTRNTLSQNTNHHIDL